MINIDENEQNGVYGGGVIEQENIGALGNEEGYNNFEGENQSEKIYKVVQNKNLPVKNDFWSKMKNFWLQEIPWDTEIKVVLTPFQQKVEREINEFLHQEITWSTVHDFLFQEIKFGKKK